MYELMYELMYEQQLDGPGKRGVYSPQSFLAASAAGRCRGVQDRCMEDRFWRQEPIF